jgi:sporulation protein YabP
MEKEIATFTHNITLNERKNLVVSGVKKIDNFDSNEFLIETTLGYLRVTGNDLEIVRLDTREGNVSIKGIVNGIIYNEDKKESKESFITKIFK